MSGQSTPFIPLLNTGDPVIAPVIPSPPTVQSPQYHPGPVPEVPAGWEARGHQMQMPPYGTPYAPASFFAVSPYSQSLPSTTFSYSPLPHVVPNGLAADYRGYREPLPHVVPSGLAADYRGYREPIQTPLMGTGGTALPTTVPGFSPQGSPWHGGGVIPLHHGPPPAVYPSPPWATVQEAHRGWPGGNGIPYTANWGPLVSPVGYTTTLPGWGGGFNGWTNPGSQQEPPRRFNREAGDRMPKFTAGSYYGPVLTTLQLHAVGAMLELNPLLTPVPESGPGSDKDYLQWNMLRESSLVRRSRDPVQVSWSIGRNEPATFPRIDVLKIVCEHYPWLIKVETHNPEAGVSCGEVIEAIAQNMEKLASKVDYQALPANLQKEVLEAYRYNRSRRPDVPGGKMGEGLKRADFLGQMTTFGGLEVDSDRVRMICSATVPGYVMLKCEKRECMMREEMQHVREQTVGSSRSAAESNSE